MDANETQGFDNCLYALDKWKNVVTNMEKPEKAESNLRSGEEKEIILYSEERKETLLEMSERFKLENPQKYAQRRNEHLIRQEESFGIYRPNRLVDSIEARLGSISVRKQAELARRKNMPPLLHLRVQYFEFKKKKRHDDHGSLISLFGDSEDNISKFEYKDQNDLKAFPSLLVQNDEKKKNKKCRVELRIMVVGATNLHKWIHSHDRKLKSRVVCAVQPDSELYGSGMSTPYTKPNYNNVTRWGHIFIIRGFNADMLMEKMITFTVEAQTSHGKKRIGYINVSTQGCILGRVKKSDADLCNNDPRFWKQFLLNPNDPVDVHLPIFPSETFRSKSPPRSLLQRLATIRTKSARMPSLHMKTFKSTGDLSSTGVNDSKQTL
uniref:uncharacterized protein LOC120329678 n=1 Tax=Styela clava TaxID=7725 RepID=UPI001939EC0B|nr:uncharacterized protein LOC120329678 [Styela clava]